MCGGPAGICRGSVMRDSVIRGQAGERFTVTSPGGSASCAAGFELGKRYRVVAWADEYEPAQSEPLDLELGAEVAVELALVPLTGIRVIVVGLPLPDAKPQAGDAAAASSDEAPHRTLLGSVGRCADAAGCGEGVCTRCTGGGVGAHGG